eukprot:988111-Prymnesium_polylepis.2
MAWHEHDLKLWTEYLERRGRASDRCPLHLNDSSNGFLPLASGGCCCAWRGRGRGSARHTARLCTLRGQDAAAAAGVFNLGVGLRLAEEPRRVKSGRRQRDTCGWVARASERKSGRRGFESSLLTR